MADRPTTTLDPATAPAILIVEDEGIVAQDIKQTVERFGYRLTGIVNNGESAIAAAERLQPDLVLMDIRLKGRMDGIEAATAIRARAGTPVVFLTSHSDETTLARAREAAPFGYVLKPFNEPALLSAIQVALHRHELEARLAERTALLEGILRAMSDAVVAVDPTGKVLLANEAAQLAGVARVDLRASGFFEASRPPPGRFDRRSLAQALRGEVVREAEAALPGPPDGAEGSAGCWLSTNASPLLGARGELLGGVSVTRDITTLKRTQLELERQAIVDELTGLYNRRGFQTLGEQQLKLARRTRQAPTLVFVDVDDMKTINDTFGHKAGDRALCDTALVLRESFRESDILGRLGGDEFVVFAIDAGDCGELLRDRVYARLEHLNSLGENPYRLSLSVGVLSCRPEEAQSMEALIALADDLMYERKSARPSRMAEALRAVRPQSVEKD